MPDTLSTTAMSDRTGRRASAGSRIAATFLFILLAVGCFALWIAVPAGGMWLAAELTPSFGWHMPVALVLVVGGMIALGAGLAWVDGLYLRVTGGEIVESRGVGIRRRGPLEPMLVATLVLAACAFCAWFFLFAENPNLAVW